jgi:ABC-type sugar transport system ATPase subunit
MAKLQLTQCVKQFDATRILDGIDLTVEPGEFMVLVGPSGCGKSTILRLISGLDQPTSGHIAIDEQDVTHVPPKDRDIAMVFQNYALYPHMTVFENLAFALKMRKLPKADITQRVQTVATMLQLDALLQRKPKQLSGGQRQRVALGRAMVRNPRIYLMDEPLSNLDAQLRSHTRGEIMRLHQQHKTTTLYVTHDQTEAMTMGHRMVVLNKGKIQQVGAPLSVYQQPANTFVAGFLGLISWATLPVQGHHTGPLCLNGPTLALQNATTPAPDQLQLGMRPESFTHDSQTEGAVPLPVNVTRAEQLGREKLVFFTVPGEHQPAATTPPAEWVAQVPPDWQGDTLWLQPDTCHWFNPTTGQRWV